MRISDWSSDVCSSDLPKLRLKVRARRLCLPGRAIGRDLRIVAQHIGALLLDRTDIAGFDALTRDPKRIVGHHGLLAQPLGTALGGCGFDVELGYQQASLRSHPFRLALRISRVGLAGKERVRSCR